MQCPKCGSEEVVKYGKSIRQGGLKQRFCCKNCGHVFTPQEEK